MAPIAVLLYIVVIGLLATAILDVWLLLLRHWGVAGLDMALLGRWVGHLGHGRVRHVSIAAAPPVRHERALGWLSHYLIGAAFAGMLVVCTGPGWLLQPTLAPALLLGLLTTAAPLLLMQPAMGAGVAGWRKGSPVRNSLRALVNHQVFGAGLYAAALGLVQV